MAVNYWVSTGDEDWDTAGNWSEGSVPATTDDVVFDGNKSNISVAGLATTNTPQSITVYRNYTGSIGSSGASVSMSEGSPHTLNRISFESATGKAWFTIGENVTCSEVICKSRNKASDAFNINTTSTGVITRLTVISGKTVVQTGCDLAAIVVGRLGAGDGDADVEVESGVSPSTNLDVDMSSGRLSSQSTLRTVIQSGGVATISGSSVTVTTLNLFGGVFTFSSDNGTLTTSKVFGGTLDLSQSGVPRTITTISVYPGGYVDARQPTATLGSPTVTVFGSGQFDQNGSVAVTYIK